MQDHHTGQEQGETFSPEMGALGAILYSSNGGQDYGGGNKDAVGERPTKTARVSPSPLTLPVVMKAGTGTAAATATATAELPDDGQDGAASAFSEPGIQQGLLEFLKAPPAIERMRQRTATKYVPSSARAASAAGGSVRGREMVT